MTKSFIDRLSSLSDIDMVYITDGTLYLYGVGVMENPLKEEKLRVFLREQAGKQTCPLIYKDQFSVYWGCCLTGKEEIYFGPMATKQLNMVELHRYYRAYGLSPKEERPLVKVSVFDILSLTGMIGELFTGTNFSDEEILEKNQNNCERKSDLEKVCLFEMEQEEEDVFHNSYEQEMLIMEAIKSGDTDSALQIMNNTDQKIGVLSKDQLMNWKKLVVISVTLCCRAAIEGGVSPEEAYRISDFYILESDNCKNVEELLSCRNMAIKILTERVRKIQESERTERCSAYVMQCLDYVSKHYKEKIYLEEIARQLKVEPTYLSRLFSKEVGIPLQKYIQKIKVEKACNLLKYSEESLSHIAEYVNFPNQSYFGKVFREFKQITPREYRQKYKTKEFISEKLSEDE